MADIITGTTTGFVNNIPDSTLNAVSDLRRETAFEAANINLENMKGFDRVNSDVKDGTLQGVMATKDARYELATRLSESTSTLSTQAEFNNQAATARSYDLAKEVAATAAGVAFNRQAIIDAVVAGADRSAQATQIAVLQNTIEGQKNTQYLSDKIGAEGDRTRELINTLKNADLNRYLIERSGELAEWRGDARHWRGNYDQAQFAAVHNQMQNMNSQLQEARQGTVNFGTMSGNAGRNTSTNNVV